MSYNPENPGSASSEIADEPPQYEQQPQQAAIDVDKTVFPNGDRLYSARIVDEQGTESFMNEMKHADGEKEVTLNGERTQDLEKIQMVEEILGVEADDEPPVDSEQEGLASDAVNSATSRVRDDVNRELRAQNPDMAVDETIAQRRTSEAVASADIDGSENPDQSIIDFVNDTAQREKNRRVIIAEQLVKDGSVDALAKAEYDEGNVSEAIKLADSKYSVEQSLDGRKAKDTTRLEELGKRAERAMAETGKDFGELQQDAEELDQAA